VVFVVGLGYNKPVVAFAFDKGKLVVEWDVDLG